MQLTIIHGNGDVIAEIQDYAGPIPRVGEYIYHPPLNPRRGDFQNVMHVRTVRYGILTRAGGPHFTGNADPYVEIVV